jgi:hypothetical protein
MHRALALLLSLAFGSSPLLSQSPQKETVLEHIIFVMKGGQVVVKR